VAYKPDVSDVRESPALDVIRLLQTKGADVRYHDPFVAELRLDDGALKSEDLTQEAIEAADLVVVLTDHSAIDWAWVVRHAHRVYDTRNATRDLSEGREKVRKL
jgi:UDP-N-acetyl-D-glucosamine dehydrogenase